MPVTFDEFQVPVTVKNVSISSLCVCVCCVMCLVVCDRWMHEKRKDYVMVGVNFRLSSLTMKVSFFVMQLYDHSYL